jgi:hypothetical protein
MGSEGISPCILNIGTRWMGVDDRLHTQATLPLVSLDRRLGGPQNRPECGGKEKNLIVNPAENQIVVFQPVT